MTRIVPASAIASPNVQPGKEYIERSTGNLEQVGHLNGPGAALAHRVDGAVAHRPADGVTQFGELRAFETNFASSLFPNERAGLPQLWRSLELPPVSPAVPGTYAPQPPLASLVQLRSASAATNVEMPLAISRLATQLQPLAQRIQNVHNSDGNPATVSLEDVRQARQQSGGFLPDEIARFGALEAAIENSHRAQPATMSAVLRVPQPGVTREAIPNPAGTVSLQLATSIDIHDTLVRDVNFKARYSRYLVPRHNNEERIANVEQAAVRRRQWIDVEVPAGSTMILLNVSGEGEQLLQAGRHEITPTPGPHRIELWSNGSRIESSEVIIPSYAKEENLDIGHLVGVPMETANGATLDRIQTLETSAAGENDKFRGVYVPAGSAVQPGEQRVAIADLSGFRAPLPAGEYAVPGASADLRLRVYGPKLMSLIGAREEFFAPVGPENVGLVDRTSLRARFPSVWASSNADAIQLRVGADPFRVGLSDRV